MMRINAIVAVITGVLMGGCASTRITIVDTANYANELRNVKIDHGSSLRILEGNTVMDLPLNSIKEIRIHQEESVNVGRELFFAVEIETREGKVIRPDDKKEGKTYVAVGGSIIGKADNGGSVTIPMDKVARLKIVRK